MFPVNPVAGTYVNTPLAFVERVPLAGTPQLLTVSDCDVIVLCSTVYESSITVGAELVTVTFWMQVLVLLLASLAVQVTVFTPDANAYGASLLRETAEQLSLVAGVPRLIAADVHPLFTDVVISGGHEIVGTCLSSTVIVKLQSVVPQPLIAVITTFVTPGFNVEPVPDPIPVAVVAPV